jgi:hypothetical protein
VGGAPNRRWRGIGGHRLEGVARSERVRVNGFGVVVAASEDAAVGGHRVDRTGPEDDNGC